MNGFYTDEELTRIIKDAAIAGAKQALAERDRHQQSSKKIWSDAKLHNTKLLLEHYLEWKTCIAESVYKDAPTPQDEEKAEIMDALMNGSVDHQTIAVKSIEASVARTRIIVAHIDHMMEVFAALAANLQPYRPEMPTVYACIRMTYLQQGDNHNVDLMCADLNISRTSYYRYLKTGYETLGDLLFGVDFDISHPSFVVG